MAFKTYSNLAPIQVMKTIFLANQNDLVFLQTYWLAFVAQQTTTKQWLKTTTIYLVHSSSDGQFGLSSSESLLFWLCSLMCLWSAVGFAGDFRDF